jgi:hypothetical protein
MSDDLSDRLRARIEELEAENERLKSALEIERETRRLVKQFLL